MQRYKVRLTASGEYVGEFPQGTAVLLGQVIEQFLKHYGVTKAKAVVSSTEIAEPLRKETTTTPAEAANSEAAGEQPAC